MPSRVEAYKCDFCGKLLKRKHTAQSHEARCNHNPDKRHCITCIHGIKAYDGNMIMGEEDWNEPGPEIHTCYCGFTSGWDESDDVHGDLWGCEKCGCTFCSKCLSQYIGECGYLKVMQESPLVLCPDCAKGKDMKLEQYSDGIKDVIHDLACDLLVSSVTQMFSCCDMNGFVLTDHGCAQAYREIDDKFYFVQVEDGPFIGISLRFASIDISEVSNESLWYNSGQFYHKEKEEFDAQPLNVKMEYLFEYGFCNDICTVYNCDELDNVIADYIHFIQTFQVR